MNDKVQTIISILKAEASSPCAAECFSQLEDIIKDLEGELDFELSCVKAAQNEADSAWKKINELQSQLDKQLVPSRRPVRTGILALACSFIWTYEAGSNRVLSLFEI